MPKKRNNIAKNNKANLVGEIKVSAKSTFSGPIPPPNALEDYEVILPGSADRILTMAENQSKHRIEIESSVINSKIKQSYIGMYLGFVLALFMCGTSTFLIYSGKSIGGLATLVTAIAGLVGAFIYGTNSNRKEREAKKVDE